MGLSRVDHRTYRLASTADREARQVAELLQQLAVVQVAVDRLGSPPGQRRSIQRSIGHAIASLSRLVPDSKETKMEHFDEPPGAYAKSRAQAADVTERRPG
jgi:hypothetical protein